MKGVPKCAPKRKMDNGSCYTDAELDEIFASEDLGDPSRLSRLEKLKKIKKLYKHKYSCSSENCWPIEDHKKVHRPQGSWGDNGWLYDSDITQCLSQYVSSDFEFLGCTVHDFWKFDLIKKHFDPNIPSYGLIVTLDGLEEKGYPHWVSIFIRKTNPEYSELFYFDPMGYEKPMKLLSRLMVNLRISLGKPVRFGWSEGQFQKYDGDCGIYALDFMIYMSSKKNSTLAEYLDKISKYTKEDLEGIRKRLFN
jgi:hypothetical protein